MVVIHKKHAESEVESDARIKKEQEKAMGLQDQYQVRGVIFFSWIEKHKLLTSTLIILLLVFGIIGFGGYYYTSQKNETASGMYLSVIREMHEIDHNKKEDEAKLSATKEKLAKILESYGSTKVAALAELTLANQAVLSQNTKDALAYYQGALAKLVPQSYIYPLVLIGLGYAQEKNADKADAIKSFEQVIDNKLGFGVELALWEAARLAKDNQDYTKAKNYVTRLLEDYPSSVYEKNAKKLKAGLPE
jgi:outer membrane protein assembly factor BamD (BamD/ComL family)